ncbi:copper homeostasis protein CutC [Mycoplasmatota bacterium WC44]
MKLEVIATTLKEAIDAERAGADRIELVTGILEGGLTPSLALIEEVSNTVSIPVNVMIRPHSKNFNYTNEDIKVILRDVELISKTNAEGIVFGSLTKDKRIDEELLKKVIKLKGSKKLTFHRAFDELTDQELGLDILMKYSVDTILTSGGKKSAYDGINKLNNLVKLLNSRIKILAGSGLNLSNIHDFLDNSSVDEIHLGSGVKYNSSNLDEINPVSIKFIKDHIKFKN